MADDECWWSIDLAIKWSTFSHTMQVLPKIMRPSQLPSHWHQSQRPRQGIHHTSAYSAYSKDKINQQSPKKEGLSSVWAKILEKHKRSLEPEKGVQHPHSGDVRASLIDKSPKPLKQQGKTPKKVVIRTKQQPEEKTVKRRGRPRKKGIFSRRVFIVSLVQVFSQQPIRIPEQSRPQIMEESNGQLYFCESEVSQAPSKVDPPPKEQKKQFKRLSFTIELQEFVEAVESHAEEVEDTNNETYFAQNTQQNLKPPQQILIQDDDEQQPQQKSMACNDSPIEIISQLLPKPLGKATLKDLVCEIYSKKFISEALYADFTGNHSFNDILTFIDKFYAGKLHQFDFQSIKFTLLDHRRISELLINLFPTQYSLGPLESPHPKVRDFLEKMYELSGEDYYNLYYKIDNISRVKWWGKILIVQEERLSSSYKEKRVNQRRAERAKQAVQDLIKSFKEKQKADDGVDLIRTSMEL